MEIVKKAMLQVCGGEIPICLCSEADEEGIIYFIEVDGVEWLTTEAPLHANVLFNLMKDHITDYMNYKKL